MARFYKPKADRAQKLSEQLKKVAADPNFALVGPRGGMAAVKALANFLASYGSKVARLSRTSRGQLLQQDATQDQAMREKAIAAVQANSKKEITEALNKYAQKKINKVALRNILQSTLKRQTLTSAIIGVRGVGNLTDNVLTAVKRQLSKQFAYLDGFLDDIETNGLTQRNYARGWQYANSGWAISQTAARQFNLDQSGKTAIDLEERRRLGGSEHCEDCVALASTEWEPFGTLPVPGEGSVCGSNCRCTMEVRYVNETSPVNQG